MLTIMDTALENHMMIMDDCWLPFKKKYLLRQSFNQSDCLVNQPYHESKYISSPTYIKHLLH